MANPDELPHEPKLGQTHWSGCWQAPGHHNCAVGRVHRLERRLERAEEVVEAAREAEKSLATAEIHSDPSRQRRLATEAYDHLCDALQAIEEQTDEQE